ncbi:MAG: hypothetical protein CMJ58_05800 [Planctomycetaceae bacterium]|nr:hypothetical protein [Planctomycetaceae bacterium]
MTLEAPASVATLLLGAQLSAGTGLQRQVGRQGLHATSSAADGSASGRSSSLASGTGGVGGTLNSAAGGLSCALHGAACDLRGSLSGTTRNLSGALHGSASSPTGGFANGRSGLAGATDRVADRTLRLNVAGGNQAECQRGGKCEHVSHDVYSSFPRCDLVLCGRCS